MARVIGTGIDPTTYTKKKKKSTSRVVGSGVNSVNYPAAQQTDTQPANTLSPMSQATLQQAAAAATNPQQAQVPTVEGSTGTAENNTPTGTTPSNGSSTPLYGSDGSKAWQQGFKPTELTEHYKNSMLETDDARPDKYQSAYEGTINSLLEIIRNQKPFDVKSDANYNALYDQYAERYKAQAQRAMNDAMASANAQTGGYGSTYGQAVGQQAYDNTMQGMNDNNLNLLNLAYQMYTDNQANDYKKLNAYQSQDNTMYGRYRDDVADWQTDRNYNANQYWNSFQQDRSGYDTDRNFGYSAEQDELNRDDNQYQNAVTTATQLAKAGLPVPSYLTDRINQYNKKYGFSGDAASALAQIAAAAKAAKAKKSSGSGGRKRSRGGDSSKSTTKDIYTDDSAFKKQYPTAGSKDTRNLMAQSEYESRYETVKNDAYEQAYEDAKEEGMIDAKAAFYARNRAKEAASAWAKKMSEQFKIIGDM